VRGGQSAFRGRGKSERGAEHGAERRYAGTLGSSELGSLGILEEPPLVDIWARVRFRVLLDLIGHQCRTVGSQFEPEQFR